MDTTGVIEQPIAAESTANQSTESSGQGQVDAQASQGEQDIAGGEQSFAEGGKASGTETRRPFRPSKNETIFELRRNLRERDQQIKDLSERFSAFEKKFQPRGQNQKPSRSFWEAPEEVLEERLANHISALEERMSQRWEQSQTELQRTTEWRQETMEATKLVQDSLKLSGEESEEFAEMLRSSPIAQRMSPLERAEYGIFKWQQAKGIADKSDLKRRAASVTGSSTQHQGGPRMWSKAEIEGELAKFPADPAKWTEDHEKQWKSLDLEIKQAYRQGRVRNK